MGWCSVGGGWNGVESEEVKDLTNLDKGVVMHEQMHSVMSLCVISTMKLFDLISSNQLNIQAVADEHLQIQPISSLSGSELRFFH